MEGRKKTWRSGQRFLVARLEVACINFVCFRSLVVSHVVFPNCKEFRKCSLALWLGRKSLFLFIETMALNSWAQMIFLSSWKYRSVPPHLARKNLLNMLKKVCHS